MSLILTLEDALIAPPTSYTQRLRKTADISKDQVVDTVRHLDHGYVTRESGVFWDVAKYTPSLFSNPYITHLFVLYVLVLFHVEYQQLVLRFAVGKKIKVVLRNDKDTEKLRPGEDLILITLKG